MKPDATKIMTESTIEGERVKMGIAEGVEGYVMDVLTNLYSDPEVAIIREPSTNAWDAHVAAGIDRPIEVTTPQSYYGDQTLSIKDYGIGLSVDDIHKVFSQYGASTKRESDDYNGQLGMGCKAPLAYAPEFTVVSNKDGVRIVVVVGRDEAGGGTMTIADTCATDEPNGTEVIIATKSFNGIASKARDFFRFWKPGTVLLNGKQPEPITGERITDDIMVVDASTNYVVMGNVAYPVDDEKLPHGLKRGKLVVNVPIGAVAFAPSREALRLTPQTKDTLDRIIKSFHHEVENAVANAVANAASGPEAIKAVHAWANRLPHVSKKDYTYKGKKLPKLLDDQAQRRIIVARNEDSKLSNHSKVPFVAASAWGHTLFVTGYDVVGFTATTKKKLDMHCDDNSLPYDQYVLLPSALKAPARMWINKDQVVKWDDIKAIKLPRNSRAINGHIAGSYEVYSQDKGGVVNMSADSIADYDGEVYWHNREHKGTTVWTSRYASVLEDDALVVMVPGNRKKKFCRDFPDVENAHVAARNKYASWEKSLSKLDKLSLAIHDSRLTYINKVDEKRIDDPEIRKVIRAAKRDTTKIRKQRHAFNQILNRVGAQANWENPLDKYMLVDSYYFGRGGNRDDHYIIYINAVYQAAKKTEKESK
jgi:hypothetical protein